MSEQARIAIVVDKVSKAFGEGETRTQVVKEAGFQACFGEMLYVVGPSGSGKTTLLSIVSGILRPDSGRVEIDGENIWSLEANALAELRLNKIGFVFQDFHLFPRLTTAENVAIPLILKRVPWDTALEEARKYLDIVGLKARADVTPTKLSGGEQQRVAIARAIVSQPRILVFDEPTASLDGETGKRIVEFIRERILTPERCILIITHDARILEFASRIMNVEDGRITGISGATS